MGHRPPKPSPRPHKPPPRRTPDQTLEERLLPAVQADYVAGRIEADELEEEVGMILSGRVPARVYGLMPLFERPGVDFVPR